MLLVGCFSGVHWLSSVYAAGLPVAAAPATAALRPTIFGESAVLPGNAPQTPLMTMPMSSLNFGRFVPGSTPGTITMTPEGMRTASGGVLLLSGDGGHPARFMVRGERDRSFRITLPSAVQEKGVRLTLITNVTTDVLTNGSQAIAVGGTLFVPANVRPGAINTSFELITDYN